jgi:hypothetical protein
MYTNPLSRLHNTSLISAYFGLDSREYKKSPENAIRRRTYFSRLQDIYT